MVHTISVLIAIAVVAAADGMAARAGTCPASQELAEPREIAVAGGIGLMRQTIAADPAGQQDIPALRIRRAIVAPETVMPAEGVRPAILYVLVGALVEHSSLCAVPIVHQAGEAAVEAADGRLQLWENPAPHNVVVLLVDLAPS